MNAFSDGGDRIAFKKSGNLLAWFLVVASSCPLLAQSAKPAGELVISLGQNTKMELVSVPPGEFMMGSTQAEKDWATGIEGGAQPGTVRESYEGEAPRKVKVTKPFWMGRTEVTVGQFRRFVEETGYVTDAEKPGGHTQCFNPKWTSYRFRSSVIHPWDPMPGKSWRDPNFQFPLQDDFPVVCVSWTDAKAFATWLNQQAAAKQNLPVDYEYRLPTEAEWEYACRAGSKTAYSFDDEEGLLPEYGWFRRNSYSRTHTVGLLEPNAWGLFDMHGNVWEFCSDWYAEYPKGPVSDPIGPSKGAHRVYRGGGWGADNASDCRSAWRNGFLPSSGNIHYGFRVALSSSEIPKSPEADK